MRVNTTTYVCEKGICDLPATDTQIFTQQLTAIKALEGTDKLTDLRV